METTTQSAQQLIDPLLLQARDLQQRLLAEMQRPPVARPAAGIPLDQLRRYVAAATARPLDAAEFTDMLAQAVVCGRFARRLDRGDAHGWSGGPLVAAAIQRGIDAPHAPAAPPHADLRRDELARFYEPFLTQHDRRRRSRHGVFYTPAAVASFIVRGVHELLQNEFGLDDGLADTSTWGQMAGRHPQLAIPRAAAADDPFVRILDPAAGTGAFLNEVVEVIHRTLVEKWSAAGHSDRRIARLWSDYVPRHLLPRLFGLELMLPAVVIAQQQLAEQLARTGYRLAGDQRLGLFLADTLADPAAAAGGQSLAAPLLAELQQTHRVRHELPFTVIVGNPPFSGFSNNDGRWIADLLRGRGEAAGATADYYRANGRPLGEKKLWLQDDYVKFLRYAHWRIDATGCGVVGLVTNHGYLDNVTFRGVRERLLDSFSHIRVLDLHGNGKKKETAPGGETDENVFAVEQGVAVGLFGKPPQARGRRVEYGELWGTRRRKLRTLRRRSADWRPIEPAAPFHFFLPGAGAMPPEYERGFSLTEIMPVNSTAVVTARDSFVVAISEQELLDRLQLFRDLSIPDDEIRRRFFTRGRSTRYPPGDTRGWKLPEARRRMAADADWRRHVRPCLYRPFDRRVIYWTDWMVDWPRPEVMRHMTGLDNLALIARRQMLPTRPSNFFWVSDAITIDGVVRSDNRGSESVFPLYLVSDPADGRQAVANFDEPFVARVSRALGLSWRGDDGVPRGDNSFGPLELFCYIYALFHSPTYRRRYAAWLRVDFPRVLLPREARLFHRLARSGRALVRRHLHAADPPLAGSQPPRHIGAGFPKYDAGAIQLGDGAVIGDVPAEVWRFTAGAHQVCRKWLKDRRGRTLDAHDLARYRQMLAAIRSTLRCMQNIDRQIDARGGWPAAFGDQ